MKLALAFASALASLAWFVSILSTDLDWRCERAMVRETLQGDRP
jgi:hypothetical protein